MDSVDVMLLVWVLGVPVVVAGVACAVAHIALGVAGCERRRG